MHEPRSHAFVSMHHGPAPLGHAEVFEMERTGRPVLDVDTGDGLGWSLSTTSDGSDHLRYGPGHVRFARQVADAASDYADRIEYLADAQDGAKFWASIDTTSCPCGGGCRWCA